MVREFEGTVFMNELGNTVTMLADARKVPGSIVITGFTDHSRVDHTWTRAEAIELTKLLLLLMPDPIAEAEALGFTARDKFTGAPSYYQRPMEA